MNNNKGQVLVMFVLLIPLIFLLFGIVVDIGLSYTEKRKLDNTTKMTLEYGLENIEKENIKIEMSKLLTKNIENIDEVNIHVEENLIRINTSSHYDSIFSTVFGKEKYQITSKYKGYNENGVITVIKE